MNRSDKKDIAYIKERMLESWEGRFFVAISNRDYKIIEEDDLDFVWHFIVKNGFQLERHRMESKSYVLWERIYRVGDKAYKCMFENGKLNKPVRIEEIL